MSQYINPIAITTYGGGYGKIGTDQSFPSHRLVKYENWQTIINELSKKYTVLHFTRGDSLLKFDNCIEINNLTINELKHWFAAIKQYVGIDTGSYHLMISVGGFAHVLAPQLSWEYQYYPPNWQYPPELWWDEEFPRVKYYNKDTEWKLLFDNLWKQ